MRISLIAGMDKNRLIGRDNGMPWHLPADLQHFRALTLNKPIVMGHSTFQSIGKALDKRRNIVMTRQADLVLSGCEMAGSVSQALALCEGCEEVMIVGGASIYEAFLSRAKRMYLTMIDAEFEGDRYFPAYDAAAWQVVESQRCVGDQLNPHAYRFLTLDRIA